ncbi:MAG TPA: hypothetical protein VMT64_17370 [Candidatus Binataceae bacterium]|nr:hypothetical protein [Candidatus Binataceae bacterium]
MELTPRRRIAAEGIALVYIAIITTTANATGAFYVLFPELGALSHDVFTRPRGKWANSPMMLAITPVLTGAIGIAVTRSIAYGFASVLLNVIGAIAIVLGLGSPVAPAISAGLLPLVLSVTSWWYPPGIAFGTVLLAGLSTIWKRYAAGHRIIVETAEEVAEDITHEVAAPVRARWEKLAALIAFVVVAVTAVKLTGWRFILFPPLVVIGFEMFVHPDVCPWASRPLMLPVACFLTALGGYIFWRFLGVTPITAAMCMGWGIIVLRAVDLHVPPALAVALLPLVMDHPTIIYPFAVGIGTLLLTGWFLLCEWMLADFAPSDVSATRAAG